MFFLDLLDSWYGPYKTLKSQAVAKRFKIDFQIIEEIVYEKQEKTC